MRRTRLFQFNLQFLLLVMLASAIAAFAWGRPKHGTVSGTITIDGSPVRRVAVVLRSATGTVHNVCTNADGAFDVELMTGIYTVGVPAWKAYANPESSGIEFQVVKGTNYLNIDLPALDKPPL